MDRDILTISRSHPGREGQGKPKEEPKTIMPCPRLSNYMPSPRLLTSIKMLPQLPNCLRSLHPRTPRSRRGRVLSCCRSLLLVDSVGPPPKSPSRCLPTSNTLFWLFSLLYSLLSSSPKGRIVAQRSSVPQDAVASLVFAVQRMLTAALAVKALATTRWVVTQTTHAKMAHVAPSLDSAASDLTVRGLYHIHCLSRGN